MGFDEATERRIWGDAADPELRVARKAEGGRVVIFCPGCRCGHAVTVENPNSQGARWTWNGDLEKPTFSPSILVKSQKSFDDATPTVCHSFVNGGMIQFLSDSTHSLAGQTVPLEKF